MTRTFANFLNAKYLMKRKLYRKINNAVDSSMKIQNKFSNELHASIKKYYSQKDKKSRRLLHKILGELYVI